MTAVAPSQTAEGQPQTAANQRAAVMEFVRALSGTAEACHVYAPDHPAALQFGATAVAHLGALLRDGAPLALYIREGGWIWRDEPLPDPGVAASAMATSLLQRGFVAVAIDRPLTEPEMMGFAETLGAMKRSTTFTGGAERVHERSGGGARLVALKTESLRLVDGARTAAQARTWQAVLGDLFAPSEAPRVSEQIEKADPESIDQLRAEVVQRAGVAARTPEAVRERLRAFVANLSPAARDALLSAPTADPDRTLPFLAGVSSELPVEQILAAVHKLGENRPTSRDTVVMFESLARSSMARGADPAAFMQTLKQWRGSSAPGTDVSRAVQELMTARSLIEFTPDDYRQQLDRAAEVYEGLPADQTLPTYSPERNEAHAAAVAAIVCRDCEWGDVSAALRRAERGIEGLISEYRFDLLVSVRKAAQAAVKAGATGGEQRLIDRLRDPAVLRAAVHQASVGESNAEAREFVIGSGDGDSILLLANHASAATQGQRRLLRAALEHTDDTRLPALVEAAVERGRESVRMLLEELCAHRGTGAPGALCAIVRGAAPRVAGEVVLALPSGPIELVIQVCEEGLRHAGEAAARAAIDTVAQRVPEGLRIEVFTRFLTGGVGGPRESEAVVCHAIESLAAAGPSGHGRVLLIFDWAWRSWRLARWRLANQIAAVMGPRAAGDGPTRSALKRWRWSVRGVLARRMAACAKPEGGAAHGA